MSFENSKYIMKRLKFHPSVLQVLYLITFFILFLFIVYTPTLIKGPVNLTSKLILEEETIEGVLLCILFITSILILNLYKNEARKQKQVIELVGNEKKIVEARLYDSEQYIGILNVQIQEIKSIFNSIDKYPETKEDLKRAFSFFGDRIIGIVNSDWVLFRIIDTTSQKTISEHFSTRKGYSNGYPHVSNKMVIDKQPISQFEYVISNPKNLNVLVFCIIPVERINNDQRVFIQAIINEVTKLFVILNSVYYKKDKKIFV